MADAVDDLLTLSSEISPTMISSIAPSIAKRLAGASVVGLNYNDEGYVVGAPHSRRTWAEGGPRLVRTPPQKS